MDENEDAMNETFSCGKLMSEGQPEHSMKPTMQFSNTTKSIKPMKFQNIIRHDTQLFFIESYLYS